MPPCERAGNAQGERLRTACAPGSGAPETPGRSPTTRNRPRPALLPQPRLGDVMVEALQAEGCRGQRLLGLSLQRWGGRPGGGGREGAGQEDASRRRRCSCLVLGPAGAAARWTLLFPAKQQPVTLGPAAFREGSGWFYHPSSGCDRGLLSPVSGLHRSQSREMPVRQFGFLMPLQPAGLDTVQPELL